MLGFRQEATGMVLRLHDNVFRRRCNATAVISTTAPASSTPTLLLLTMLFLAAQMLPMASVRGSELPAETLSHGEGVSYHGGADAANGILGTTLRPATKMSVPVPNRKLLQKDTHTTLNSPTNSTSSPIQPFRIGYGCSNDDVAVYQSATDKMPSGIPTFTVRVLNVCASGCAVAGIHLTCGWYSSAKLVNPKLFRRLAFDDCLVNDGQAIFPGEAVVFTYADSRKYPMAVKTLSCVPYT